MAGKLFRARWRDCSDNSLRFLLAIVFVIWFWNFSSSTSKTVVSICYILTQVNSIMRKKLSVLVDSLCRVERPQSGMKPCGEGDGGGSAKSDGSQSLTSSGEERENKPESIGKT